MNMQVQVQVQSVGVWVQVREGAGATKFGPKAVRTGTYQTKKITYILARPQNEKVEKAASRRSKNIDNEAKSRQIRPLTSS